MKRDKRGAIEQMNINSMLLNNSVPPKQVNNAQSKQTSFGLNSLQNNSQTPQFADAFVKRVEQEPKNVVFLKFIMPKVFPYNAIKGVFVPRKDLEPMNIQGEPVVMKSGNIDINCWFIPPQPGKPTVLLCHGNAENITHSQPTAKQLAAQGIGVFMVDYEGYGKNEGTPSESKLYQNALDGAKYLNEQKGIPNNQIIVMGHSLGGPIAAHTAASVPEGNHFKAVILDSTVPSMAALVKSWIDHDYIAKTEEPKENYPLERVINDLKTGGGLFLTKESIPKIPASTKILVVHSVNDNVVDGIVGKSLMDTVKAFKPDAETFWEKESSKSHQNYTCRMPKILDFISSLPN
ncbi:MAG: alpha/beta fold hydrolase [Cyanobacteriota bacterium]